MTWTSLQRDAALPHPAEDLSKDDDLLSWMLVDQLASMPGCKLGVHPQQVGYVGPSYKLEEVLAIVKETAAKGNIQDGVAQLQEHPVIQRHLDSKQDESQQERFIKHLRRYLLPYLPSSRVEFHLTSRYTSVTGHTELAVFATKPLKPNAVLHELQGSVVPLPDEWKEEMDLGGNGGPENDYKDSDTDEADEADKSNEASLGKEASKSNEDKGASQAAEGNDFAQANVGNEGNLHGDRVNEEVIRSGEAIEVVLAEEAGPQELVTKSDEHKSPEHAANCRHNVVEADVSGVVDELSVKGTDNVPQSLPVQIQLENGNTWQHAEEESQRVTTPVRGDEEPVVPVKRGRGRPRKSETLAARAASKPKIVTVQDDNPVPIKRGRGRPRKEETVKRGRGRPRKSEPLPPPVKRGRGRPRLSEQVVSNSRLAGSTGSALSKGKETELRKMVHRRSARVKRRDFSIVWSGLKRCFQLFLGPARFLNHDCSPNVELLRQGAHVTFKVLRPVVIGEELTTFYGENYFGKDNIECLCLTCETKQKGGFTPAASSSRSRSRAGSDARSTGEGSRIATPATPVKASTGHLLPSSLRTSTFKQESSSEALLPVVPPPKRGRGRPRKVVPVPFIAPQDGLASLVPPTITQPDPSASLVVAEKPNLHRLRSPQAQDGAEASTPKVHKGKRKAEERDGENEASDASGDSSSAPPTPAMTRSSYQRQVNKNQKPFNFSKRFDASVRDSPFASSSFVAPKLYIDKDANGNPIPASFARCVTCCKPLVDRIWFNKAFFEYCDRCLRHALIFDLRWPARRDEEVEDYPPRHLIPPDHLVRRITSIPLPSLSRGPRARKEPTPTPSPPRKLRESKEEKIARKLQEKAMREKAKELRAEAERLRKEAAEVEYQAELKAKEVQRLEAVRLREEAKAEAKRLMLEAKRKRKESAVKGSGLWSRYEYRTPEEEKAIQDAKRTLTSGTRRGKSFRAASEEEEMARLAEEQAGMVRGPKRTDETSQPIESQKGEVSGSATPLNPGLSTSQVTPCVLTFREEHQALAAFSHEHAGPSRGGIPSSISHLMTDVIDLDVAASFDNEVMETVDPSEKRQMAAFGAEAVAVKEALASASNADEGLVAAYATLAAPTVAIDATDEAGTGALSFEEASPLLDVELGEEVTGSELEEEVARAQSMNKRKIGSSSPAGRPSKKAKGSAFSPPSSYKRSFSKSSF